MSINGFMRLGGRDPGARKALAEGLHDAMVTTGELRKHSLSFEKGGCRVPSCTAGKRSLAPEGKSR